MNERSSGIRRPFREGEQAHLCEALDQQSLFGRCRRNRRKEYALTWGDLEWYVLPIEKSAEAILAIGNEPIEIIGGLTR